MRRPSAEPISSEDIGSRILLVRGQKVLLDADLARLYAVTSKRLNEQVRRNPSRFPADFVFQLKDHEVRNLRSQIATSSSPPRAWGGRRYAPYAFTEHGALMAANVLNSARAVEVAVYIVRAFVRLRQTLADHRELSRKLEDLERKTEALALEQNKLAAATRAQFKEVIEALRQLMAPPPSVRRPIGFVTQR